MKKFEDFKIEKLTLSSIQGGTSTFATSFPNGDTQGCDVHEDDNDNGKMDPGECSTVVACE